jgi:hypothetical protein
MNLDLNIPDRIFERMTKHLFQGRLEQGAFLFAKPEEDHLLVENAYLIPADAWAVQLDVYLEMKDSARARVMNEARRGGWAVVDCHSHPGAGDDVWFSPSDIAGIAAFAQYAKWKLDGKPYVAMVWGEQSLDAVVWSGSFTKAEPIRRVRILKERKSLIIAPRNTWFKEPRAYWRKARSSDE